MNRTRIAATAVLAAVGITAGSCAAEAHATPPPLTPVAAPAIAPPAGTTVAVAPGASKWARP